MADPLSVSNLLSLLQVDRNTDVMNLCQQAEGWRRRAQFEKAIEVAQSAVQLAQNSFDLLGISSLYLSYARMCSYQSVQRPIGLRECDRAIRTLSLSPFNHAIAQIVRGTFEIWAGVGLCERNALPYVDRARQILEDLIVAAKQQNDLDNLTLYQELLDLVCCKIDQLSAALSEMCANNGPLPPVLPPLPTPTQLSRSTRLEWTSFPNGVPFEFVLSESGPNISRVSHVMVKHRLCVLFQPVSNASGSSSILPESDGFYVMPIVGVPNQYVLARKCKEPDQTNQLIIAVDDLEQEVWVDEPDFRPPFTLIHMIGADTGVDVHIPSTRPRTDGVVVAVLVELPSPAQLTKVKIEHSRLTGVHLPQANLSKAEFFDVDLSGAILEGANLSGVNMRDVECYKANLKHANLQEAKLSGGVTLRETQLDEAQLYGANLENLDFRGARAYLADLRQANLRGANLAEAQFEQANFDGADLSGANLAGTRLSGARLQESDLHWVTLDSHSSMEPDCLRIHRVVNSHLRPSQVDAYGSFVGAVLYHVRFIGFNLTRSDFRRANLTEVDFRGSQLHDVTLEEANLYRANLRGAKLARARFNGAYLSEADLRRTNFKEADLSNTYMDKTDLRRAGLSSANLSRTILHDALLDDADFQEADLYCAQLQRIKARRTRFGNAKLVKANLREAELPHAYLGDVDLRSADLTGADLSNANLLGARVTKAQLDSAKSLAGAIMPDGSIHP